MSTAVASSMAAPLHQPVDEHSPSPRAYANAASTSSVAPTPSMSSANATSTPPHPSIMSSSRVSPKTAADGKTSPKAFRNGHHPKIIVKKEPGSPGLPTSRHRPSKLDLSKDSNSSRTQGPRTGGPMTGRDSNSALGMQDVGLACLSPGFSTQDPTMREQLQRSISVRDQQRHIIESRLNKSAKGDGPGDGGAPTGEMNPFPGMAKAPSTSRRKPAGLSIVPPAAENFANEHRVVQSAPLNQTFTGLHRPHPMTRHVVNQPSNLSNSSHIHHVPAQQTANRLPPITDVFASERLGQHRERESATRSSFQYSNNNNANNSNSNSSHSNHRPQFPSPGNTREPPTAPLTRPREFRSSEEAVVALAGGREELLPKIVHYGGHQPPTPPSPLTHSNMTPQKPTHSQPNGEIRGQSGRRRTRAEYEQDNSSPPLGRREELERERGYERRDILDINGKKKEKFMSLISEAWDVLHS